MQFAIMDYSVIVSVILSSKDDNDYGIHSHMIMILSLNWSE